MNSPLAQPEPEHDACGVGFVYHPESSRQVIDDALTALTNLEHRGALGGDGQSGDGAGILTAIPWQLLKDEGWAVSGIRAVGVVFLPVATQSECRDYASDFFVKQGFSLLGWRAVPVNKEVLGPDAADTCPQIELVLLSAPEEVGDFELEEKLLVSRKRLINQLWSRPFGAGFYIASLSSSSIVYKAMVKSEILAPFYADLQSNLFESKWAIFHRRFSTNTSPNWRLAQPFRMLAHNGEINTLSGNRNWLHAREMVMEHPLFADRRETLRPLVHPLGSDSANLDNLFELYVLAGLSPQEAMMRLMPEAHSEACHLPDPDLISFYEYHSALQEPWDGPALIAFSDGKTLGASLDRNGLRPARYTVLKNGSIVLCSEVGVLDLPATEIIEKGRLGPGQMIAVDIASGRFQRNADIKKRISQLHPYSDWLAQHRIRLKNYSGEPGGANGARTSAEELLQQQQSVGYGQEDVDQILGVMADTAHEPVFSMGDDTALPVLSKHPRCFFDYFRQRFAQVTNPPIDHLREEMVFSLRCYLGQKSTAIHPSKEAAHVIELESPFLTENQLAEIEALKKAARVHMLFSANDTDGLLDKLKQICHEAAECVRNGAQILILSDRGISTDRAVVPVLLAVGAVHSYLTEKGLRMSCSIVAETAQAWSTHQFACLLGYGAEAICPYLAFESIRHRCENPRAQTNGGYGSREHSEEFLSNETAIANFLVAARGGLLKVMSKMGISAVTSYTAAQIFECIGVGKEVIQFCFPGTASHMPGLSFAEIENETRRFHELAFNQSAGQLENRGFIRYRNGGEYHGNNPELVATLHQALGYRKLKNGNEGKMNAFLKYASLTRKHDPGAVRDLLTFVSDREPIDISEVESASEIVKCFCSGGMSLGALSPEAHTVMAVAMNRLGAKSNSGEGGEDPLRYKSHLSVNNDGTSSDFPGITGLKPGDCGASAIRQVASARFGVTPAYLVTAKQLEIKMAQGAKPGEGGQLPGAKVSQYIAKLRCADEGTTLISPPTHHDIYSIEDLAQLIFDLKHVNPQAAVSVKLVAETGIGTIAAGVAKAKADIIQISGHDGGTGASPLSSIKHAGIPWEFGLAEVQRVLTTTGLRKRVLLRVDGGLRSAWDIVIAALLGAEEFGFGSIALVAQGCIMARVCHTNNCPVGITSQKEALRKKFPGLPEKVVDFFMFLAEDVRYMLAGLGYKSLSELTGRADLLRERHGVDLAKTASLDLSVLLNSQQAGSSSNRAQAMRPYERSESSGVTHGALSSNKQSLQSSKTLDDLILSDANVSDSIRMQKLVERSFAITNRDRATGSRIAGKIVSIHGDQGFTGQVTLHLKGAAGQSFGAFLVNRMKLYLTGESNDYVGKGMNGGEIIIRPYENFAWDLNKNIIVGNACLYGATGGALYAAGQAGERFAVRNSRAVAVIEGTGDHCCEYMTGGKVVVLGYAGRNFGAGMTGGDAYVLDEEGSFAIRCNIDAGMELTRIDDNSAKDLLNLVKIHWEHTQSARAKEIMDRFHDYRSAFWHVHRRPPAITATVLTTSATASFSETTDSSSVPAGT